MADEHRTPPRDLSWLDRLAREPSAFDFYVAMRRFDTLRDDFPRVGNAERAGDESVRLGQVPSSTFEPRALTAYEPTDGSKPAQIKIGFLGLWGPSGPLPAHLTEYARERMRNHGDATLVRFADIFHHRALALFYRAWAQAQPTVQMDRPESDAFSRYVGAFCGLGVGATRGRIPMPDAAIFHYAGQIAAGPRNPDGLRDILFDLFGLPVTIEEFVGQWLELPADSTWKLGISPDTGRLGRTTVMGRSVWSRTNKFRIALGPLDPFGIESMLPHGADLEALRTIVRLYTNDEWAWDVALRLDASSIPPLRLGSGARLGWSTRLPGAAVGEQQLVVDPEKMLTQRLSAHRSSSPS